MLDNSQEIPFIVTYYTNTRTICKKQFGSFAHFGAVLNYFERNLKKLGQLKLKSKYILNNRKVEHNDLLMNLIQPLGKSKKIINANLFIEIEEENKKVFEKKINSNTKVLQPRVNPFEIYILDINEGALSLKQLPKQVVLANELDKVNIYSAYCNSNKELFISGGNYYMNELRNLWIINNETFNIRKFYMRFPKSNHSMIYINHNCEELIFFAGGNDLRTFNYYINNNKFSNWGNMNYSHFRPALINIGDFIYCFDTSSKNEMIFERTNLNDAYHKWEKMNPNLENEKINNLVNSGFGLVACSGGKIMICGGDIIDIYTYLYDIEKNSIFTNNKHDDILFTFSDKNFYKINNSNYIGLPSSLDEEKEVLVVDKNKYTLKKINLNSKDGIKKLKNFSDKISLMKNSLIGNIHIELKTKDILIDNNDNNNKNNYKSNYNRNNNSRINNNHINDKKNNNNNDEYDNSENTAFYESKVDSEKPKVPKNEALDEMDDYDYNYDYDYDYDFMNDNKENQYIVNNDNFENYKQEKKVEDDYLDNFDDDDFDGVKKVKNKKKIDIKLNYNDKDDCYEVEGNNFIFDSNKKNYKDIKNNNEKYNIKYIPNKGNKNKKVDNQINNEINKNNSNMQNDNYAQNKNIRKKYILNKQGGKKECEIPQNDTSNQKNNRNIIDAKLDNGIKKDDNNYQNINHNNMDYNEEKIEENNEQYNNENNEKNNLENIKEDGNEDYNEHNEDNLEEIAEQNNEHELNDGQIEDQKHIQNDDHSHDQNYIKNDEQEIEQNHEIDHEQNSAQYNEENIEENAFDEDRQISNNENEDVEHYEEENYNDNNNEEEIGEYIENDEVNEEEEGDVEEYKDEMDLEGKQNNYIENENEENNGEENIDDANGEEQEDYDEPQERDKFELTIVQPIGEDIIQIENHPTLYYYDENNFCDYDIKSDEITF